MDQAEKEGLGASVLVHLGLLILIVLFVLPGFTMPKKPLPPQPIEVSFTDEVGLVSTAPEASTEAPAPLKGPEEPTADPEPQPQPPEPEPVRPQPKPKPPAPTPAPTPAPKVQPKPPTPKTTSAPPTERPTRRPAQPARGSNDLDKIIAGINPDASEGDSRLPVAQIGAEARSSLDAEIRRQLKRYWRAPTGADMEMLRTIVELRLNPDGSLAAEPRLVEQKGVTPSNRPQAALHFEAAVRAIKLAAPFKNLPPQYYNYWKRSGPAFDRRLSQ